MPTMGAQQGATIERDAATTGSGADSAASSGLAPSSSGSGSAHSTQAPPPEAEPCLPPRSAIAPGGRASGIADPVPYLEGYQIIGKLGVGGMGTVWRAWQMSTRREVALKLLNFSGVGSQKAQRRFDREVEVSSRLQHPHIARIYDTGVHQGLYFYAMELIDGVALDEFARRGRLDQQRVLRLIATVCRAVQHAHQRGVIHRDLKPSNILVDKEGNPHVVDFGLGKVYETTSGSHRGSMPGSEESPPPATITMEGEWAGTPAYMSPEQAAGRVDQLDTRTDVYSLGVILYQLLTGHMPHDVSGGNVRVVQRILDEEIVRPRSAAPTLDRELEALLLKALARQPDDRYASAGALGDDIENYLKGEPLTARQPTAFYFLRKKLRKHRLPLGTAAAVLATLIGVSVYGSIQVARQRDAAAVAARSERELRVLAELRLAEGLVGWGDGLAREDRWDHARQKYWDAYDLERDHGLQGTAARFGLLCAYQAAPLPLWQFGGATAKQPAAPKDINKLHAAVISASFDVDSRSLTWVDRVGRVHHGDFVRDRIELVAPHTVRDVHAARTSDDGRTLVRVYWRGDRAPSRAVLSQHPPAIEILDLRGGGVSVRIPFFTENFSFPAISDDQRFVAFERARDLPDVTSPQEFVLYDLVAARGALDNIKPKVLQSSSRWTQSVAFSPDKHRLYAVNNDGELAEWELPDAGPPRRTQIQLPDTPVEGVTVQELAAAPDGGKTLILGSRGVVAAFDLGERRVTRVLHTGRGNVSAISFSTDGSLLASGDTDGIVRLFDFPGGRLLRAFKAHTGGAVRVLTFRKDGELLCSGAEGGQVCIWPLNEVVAARPLSRSTEKVATVAISPDGRLAAIGHNDRHIHVLDVATGKVVRRYRTAARTVSLHFASHEITDSGGPTLCAADFDSRAVLVDLHTNRVTSAFIQRGPNTPPPEKLHFPDGRNPGGTAFSPDGRLSIQFSPRGAARWDTKTGRVNRVLDLRPCTAASFSPDGKLALVATVSGKFTIEVWHAEGGLQRSVPVDVSGTISATAIAPGGRLIAIGDLAGMVQVIELKSAKVVWSTVDHRTAIRFLTFTPDGRCLLSTSSDKTVRLWDATSGRHLRTISDDVAHAGVTGLSADGGLLVAAGGDGTLTRAWDLSWPLRARQVFDDAANAAHPTRDADPTALIARHALRGRLDWVHLLATDGERSDAPTSVGADTDMPGGIMAPTFAIARASWVKGDTERAARAFAELARRHDAAGAATDYLQICQDAIARERAGEDKEIDLWPSPQVGQP